jgi:hypothetical protein
MNGSTYNQSISVIFCLFCSHTIIFQEIDENSNEILFVFMFLGNSSLSDLTVESRFNNAFVAFFAFCPHLDLERIYSQTQLLPGCYSAAVYCKDIAGISA